MRYVWLVLALTTTVHADDQRAARKAAEDLERDGKQSKDPVKLVACGNAYLDLYTRYAGPGGDEDLYNAGVCFDEGKARAAALHVYDLLRRMYPTSKIAPHALARSAKTYADILQFDKAAERLEAYATKYAGQKDAYDAMSDATSYRRALGDHERTIANTSYFVKTFGAKKPRAAAEAMLNLTSAYDGDHEKQIAHLKEVLRAQKLDDAQKAFVYTKLGDAQSAQSCPVPLQEGLCVRLERDRRAKHCGKDAMRLAVGKRTAQHADARASYAAAAKLYERLSTDPTGQHFATMAKLALADEELEKLLERPVPKHKLEDWLREATKLANDLNGRYEAIIAVRDPYSESEIAAAARTGQTMQALWRMLRAADPPKTGCKKVEELGAPLATRAGDLFEACLQRAAKLGVYDAYTRMCLREGQVVDAARFPPRDVFPDPATVAIPMIADKIGEPDWRAGRRETAIKAWEAALNANAMLSVARINLMIARYEQLRVLLPKDAARKQLEADITSHAQSAAGVDDHPAPLVVLAVLALDDKKKLELASLLLEEAVRVNDKYAPAHVGLGVLAVRRDRWSTALAHFERAVELDPTSESALLALALASLRVGRFDAAAKTLATIKTATYEVELARGVAARGLGKRDAAKAAYERAIKLDASRTEAQHNLRALKP